MAEQTLNMADNRHPLTAALLSVIPGLGQLYNGERRKGVLFLDVSILNFILLWMILFTEPMIKSLNSFAQDFHIRPNESVMMALQHAHFGSPASMMILAMMVAFGLFAARDAYDRAFVKRRSVYPTSVIELSEATSGSYIIHISLMVTFAVLALFFLAPPPPRMEVRTIEFVQPFEEEPKPVVKTDLKSAVNMRDHGRRDLSRPLNRSSADDEARRATNQSEPAQTKTASTTRNTNPETSAPVPPADVPPPVPVPRLNAPHPNVAPPMPMTRAIDVKPSNSHLLAAKLPMPFQPSMPAPQRLTPTAVMRNSLGPHSNLSASSMTTPVIASAAGVPTGFLSTNPHAVPTITTGKGPLPSLPAVGTASDGSFFPNLAAPVKISTSAGTGAGSAPDVVPIRSPGSKNGTDSGPTAGTSGGPQPTRAATGGNFIGDSAKVLPRLREVPGSESGKPDANGLGSGSKSTTNPSKSTDDEMGRDATESMPDFGQYMADLQRRIKKQWFPPRGASSKRVVVIFTVHRDGHMTDLQRERNSGDAIDLQAAMTAVQNAAPFRPLPAHSPASVDIQFTFDYNVLVDGAPRRF